MGRSGIFARLFVGDCHISDVTDRSGKGAGLAFPFTNGEGRILPPDRSHPGLLLSRTSLCPIYSVWGPG